MKTIGSEAHGSFRQENLLFYIAFYLPVVSLIQCLELQKYNILILLV